MKFDMDACEILAIRFRAIFATVWITHKPAFLTGLLLVGVLPAACGVERAAMPAVPPVGLNKFDLFNQYLGTASGGNGSTVYRRVTRAMARKALDDARDAGVGWLRVSASGFAPSAPGARGDLDLWRSSPSDFWSQVDTMMDDLDARGMQLVPVLMWNMAQFPAMSGETVADLIGEPGSASWRVLAEFTTEFVTRYRGRKTILFYELTNELNLAADLDNVRRCDRSQQGKGCDVAGRFSTDEMIAFTGRFAGVIRKADSTRLISSGFSTPRGSAEHLRARPGWQAGGPDWTPDSREQFAKNLTDIHAAVDIISLHLYDLPQNRRFGSTDTVDLLVTAKRVADQAGKPLFVGEFGDMEPRAAGPGSYVDRMLKKIGELRIPYSAVWAWEFYQRTPYLTYDNQHTAYNLEPGYTDFLIDRIRAANLVGAVGAAKIAGPDTTPPRIVLTWPLECALLTGQVRIHALASDENGPVSRVEFSVAGHRSSVSAPPYVWELNTKTLAPGEYEIDVKAHDAAGNVGSSSMHIFAHRATGSERCLDGLGNP